MNAFKSNNSWSLETVKAPAPLRCLCLRRSQPVLRNTVFAGLSGAVVIYGVATKLVGPPGARGNTGALAQH